MKFEQFKFNRMNPTSRWRLNLADSKQRTTMLQLVAINNDESEYSKNHSKRGDTSQWGNWFNFRNVRYNSTTEDFLIDKEFLLNVPMKGIIQFDYVSTTRPKIKTLRAASATTHSAAQTASTQERKFSLSSPRERALVAEDNELDDDAYFNETFVETIIPTSTRPTAMNINLQNFAEASPISTQRSGGADFNTDRLPFTDRNHTYSGDAHFRIITDDDFYRIINQLGLSTRNRAGGSIAIFVLMELQHAVAKYYFPCSKVVNLLDYFVKDHKTLAKVVVCLFSRIWDLHNFETIMRSLNTNPQAQHQIMMRLGCLNIVNPLKPNLNFNLTLKYVDHRNLVHSLMEISAADSGDQFREDPTTELSVVELYGSTQRLLKESRPEIMKFTFCEVGERSVFVAWTMRRDQLRRYLIGDANCLGERDIFRIISMYKEMEAEKMLARGPIELQYAQFLRAMKGKRTGLSSGGSAGLISPIISPAAASTTPSVRFPSLPLPVTKTSFRQDGV